MDAARNNMTSPLLIFASWILAFGWMLGHG